MNAVALHAHREGSIQGLLHVPLLESVHVPMLSGMGSIAALTPPKRGELSNAVSLPNLARSESPSLLQHRAATMQGTGGHLIQPVYHSLLVTGGKGHTYYMEDQDMFQESTAVRERGEAFQLIVWGYENTNYVNH